MAFEFFFGVFGLISSDSKSRHKSRLESEWRLPNPLNTHLFQDAGFKSAMSGSPISGSPLFKPSTPTSVATLDSKKRPIFSTTGTMASGTNGAGNESGMFGSNLSSSASSIASSGSNQTTNSTTAFIKPNGDHSKKYEYSLNLTGGKVATGQGLSSAPQAASNLRYSAETVDTLAANLNSKLLNQTELEEPASEPGVPPTGYHDDQDPALVLTGASQDNTSDNSAITTSSDMSRTQKLRKIYCLIVCSTLWLHVFRLVIGMLFDKSMLTLDFYSLGTYKIHFLIPALCLAIQAAAVATLFVRNNDETNWLVPFYSSKDYLIRSRSNYKPKIEDYTRRVNISVFLALFLALVSSISLTAYLVHCVGQSDMALAKYHHEANLNRLQQQLQQQAAEAQNGTSPGVSATTLSPQLSIEMSANRLEQLVLVVLLTLDIIWAIYSTYICFLVSFYFNLICSIMKARFHSISKIIEDLAESNTTKTTNQARKITTLYLEHNEACELLDESNDFWQYLIFFTYFTYIPAYCYCLYNLFFVDFEPWPHFITWVIHTHTGFIILLISFSAAGVSTEAHAPYTSLHTLSLIQLPLDVEVNIATFLHRVRGLTIGYSCYDLFAITNASMSNTAAACASYFLIVADFSRSSVFTLAQINGSTAAAAAAAGAAVSSTTTPTP